jgi:uncharacterized membrane protein
MKTDDAFGFATDDSGSIAPLALLSLALTLTCALVVLCAGSLFQQQRTLNAMADALALTIARDPAKELSATDSALRDLQSAKTAGARVFSAEVDPDGVASVRICQPARVEELMVPRALSERLFGEVCAEARAGRLANT